MSYREEKRQRRSKRRSEKRGYRQERREKGYGLNLYRNKHNRKIAGVCSGLADHFGFDPLVIRIAFIIAIFTPASAFAIPGYIVAWVLLDVKDENAEDDIDYEYDENIRGYRPRTIFSKNDSSSVRAHRAQERLERAVKRVEEMEMYVTSKKFNIDREFANLKD